MGFRPIDDLEPVGQAADDGGAHGHGANLVQLGFRAGRIPVDLETLPEVGGPKVLEASLLAGVLKQLERAGHAGRDRSTTVRPLVRRCSWSSSAAATCDMLMRRPMWGRITPSVSIPHSASWTCRPRSGGVGTTP